ncbi:hypothetical protein ACJJTC_006367 [Scirpophaga incertulas]
MEGDNQSNPTSKSFINKETTENSNTSIQKADKGRLQAPGNINIFLVVCILGVSLGLILEILNASNRNRSTYPKDCFKKPKYWVFSANSDVDNRNGLLKHVHLVLERYGYEKSGNTSQWTLLWSHDYPFRALFPNLHKLRPHQRVNHFPGTGFITNKVDLATSQSKYIPKAFKLPQSKADFLDYAAKNKHAVFLEKHNQHRGVFLRNVTEIDLSSGESFVQEYVQKPYLVDGHKFDIGVYVVVTSVNPLRVYWYTGDVLFRYCPAKYYPFDPTNLDKYVIGDDYLPTWEVPSLAHPYTALGFGMKSAFDIYVKSKGDDPSRIWQQVQEAIAEVFVTKEKHIIEALRQYPSQDNFFEMMRFDLVVDEELRVYLLEANMSPNLSSAHYPPNQLLYEQVLYSLFSITGVGSHSSNDPIQSTEAASMVASQKNIAVWGTECSTMCRDNCNAVDICSLCKPCLTHKLKNSLLRAHKEFLHQGDFRRLFPTPMEPKSPIKDLHNLTEINRLQYLWYQGKCNQDVRWCV